jgi:ketosteroid isomerase-like protein
MTQDTENPTTHQPAESRDFASDYARIATLLYRYAELLNTGQFNAVGALFARGQVRVQGNPQAYEGADAVAQMYRSTVTVPAKGPNSLLYTTNLQVEVDGDNAMAKSYFVALHERPGQLLPVVGGRYRDELQYYNGAWEFRERLMMIDMLGDLGDHLSGSIEDYLPDRA